MVLSIAFTAARPRVEVRLSESQHDGELLTRLAAEQEQHAARLPDR
jgi:hypothetical protein